MSPDTLDEEVKKTNERINHYRNITTNIKIKEIFEPMQMLVIEGEISKVEITTIEDLLSWQKEISYSFLVKSTHIENQIIKYAETNDFYTAAILLRHHMEQCGFITLAMEKMLEFIKTRSFSIIEDFIAKTLFGSPFVNNKKFKYIPEALSMTKTPNIVSFINALDRFIEQNCSGPDNKNKYSKNYSASNHFAHPSSLSSSFFTKAQEVEGGHKILFSFEQYSGGNIAKYYILRLLEQNMLIGYSAYYILNSFILNSDGTIEQDEDMIKFAYDNFINVFKTIQIE
jgi:hypothetical protein